MHTSLDKFLFTHFATSKISDLPAPDKLMKMYRKSLSERKGLEESKGEELYEDGSGLKLYMKYIVTHEGSGDAELQSKKLLTLFGNTTLIFKYLSQHIKQFAQAKTPIHDACLFEIPKSSEKWTVSFWRKLAKEHMANKHFKDLLLIAPSIEAHADFNLKLNLKGLTNIAAKLAYGKDAKTNPEAAFLFRKYNVPKETFLEYLDLAPIDDDKLIPNIYIEKKEGKSTYTLKKLSSKDPHVPVLGYELGCCQYIGNKYGHSCVVYGITKPNSGFYVISHKGEHMIGIWAWRQGDTLVFDSVEPNQAKFKHKVPLINKLVRELAEAIIKDPKSGVKQVLVDAWSKRTPRTLGVYYKEYSTYAIKLAGYKGHSDSLRGQKAVAIHLDLLCEALSLPKETSEEKAFAAVDNIKSIAQWNLYTYYFDLYNKDVKQWNKMLEKLKSVEVDEFEFCDLIQRFKGHRLLEVLVALKDQIPKLIRSNDNFHYLINFMDYDQCFLLCQQLSSDHVSSFFPDLDAFSLFIKYVSVEKNQKKAVLKGLSKYVIELVKTAEDFIELFMELNPKFRTDFYEVLRDKIPMLFKSKKDITILRYLLTADQYKYIRSRVLREDKGESKEVGSISEAKHASFFSDLVTPRMLFEELEQGSSTMLQSVYLFIEHGKGQYAKRDDYKHKLTLIKALKYVREEDDPKYNDVIQLLTGCGIVEVSDSVLELYSRSSMCSAY